MTAGRTRPGQPVDPGGPVDAAERTGVAHRSLDGACGAAHRPHRRCCWDPLTAGREGGETNFQLGTECGGRKAAWPDQGRG